MTNKIKLGMPTLMEFSTIKENVEIAKELLGYVVSMSPTKRNQRVWTTAIQV